MEEAGREEIASNTSTGGNSAVRGGCVKRGVDLCVAFLVAVSTLCPGVVLAADATASAAERRLCSAGFVEPVREDPTLRLDLRYAMAENFVHRKVYPSGRCFLRSGVTNRLLRVQTKLLALGYGLKLYDCYRPFSVQEEFWSIVPDERYVSRPERKNGVIVQSSRHNRGAAVDVTLVDAEGRDVPMPTGFDDFTSAAHRGNAAPGSTAARNSGILERAMTSEGFLPLATEWWHFDDPAWEKYPPLDLPLPAAVE